MWNKDTCRGTKKLKGESSWEWKWVSNEKNREKAACKKGSFFISAFQTSQVVLGNTKEMKKREERERESARAREREKRLSEDSEEELWRIESTLSSNNHVSCQHTRPTLKGHHYKGAFSPLSPARSCTPTNPHTRTHTQFISLRTFLSFTSSFFDSRSLKLTVSYGSQFYQSSCVGIECAALRSCVYFRFAGSFVFGIGVLQSLEAPQNVNDFIRYGRIEPRKKE